jgi:2-hydroxychromene-2-carboxylate isomerase
VRPVLYFDVGSPYSFLAVERVERVLGEAPEFQPVLLGGLFRLAGRGSWAEGDPARREAGMLEIESRAMAYDLPAIRWPRRWPGDYLTAMRIATWAQRLGAAADYAYAGGRRAFLAGCDLSLPAEAAAAAAEALARAPASLKSRVYSAMVTKLAERGPLRTLPATKAAGRDLCVFEHLLCAFPHERLTSMNPCRVCHARLLAERFESPPIYWPHCPYVEFQRK